MDLAGVPHWLDLAGITPPWLGGVPSPPAGSGWGTPPQDGWTDTRQNISFPRTTYAVGNESGRPLHTLLTCYSQ